MSDLFKTITTVRPSSRDVESITTRQNQTPDITKAQQTADEALSHPPIGSMMGWAGQSDPPGDKWLICDGRLLNSLVFPALFNAIGQTWNLGGENAGEFRIPDMRSRTQVGAGQGTGLTNRVAGTQFGAETHTLATTQIPSHSHTASGGSHSHTASGGLHSHSGSSGATGHSHGGSTSGTGDHTHTFPTNAGLVSVASGTTAFARASGTSQDTTFGAGAHSHSLSTDFQSHSHSLVVNSANATPSILSADATPSIASTGGGANHNNMQPSAVAHFIIRAL